MFYFYEALEQLKNNIDRKFSLQKCSSFCDTVCLTLYAFVQHSIYLVAERAVM